jgi:pimeloyl-ACP methyl ester carboxylesterase
MTKRRGQRTAALRPSCFRLAAAAVFLVVAAAAAGAERRTDRDPVAAVGDQRIEVQTSAGSGSFFYYASRPLGEGLAQPDIEQAVLVLHGVRRNADVYFATAKKAAHAVADASAHTLLIAPQFLAERDVRAHTLPTETLRWSLTGWEGGEAALAPAPLSSFDAIDALLGMLADRRRFPKLSEVVVAGHSGGGQMVQRYAVVGQGEARLVTAGVKVRYVVANPSSYLYFSADRPQPGGTFASPANSSTCANVDQWKYGWGSAPPYAQRDTPAAYETRYLQRDVIYLLGGADTDPNHPALDKSCAGESQGAYRLVRGRNYMAYLQTRHPGFRPVAQEVAGVGHDGERMFTSACGLAALFGDSRSVAACAR